jgi:prefoldin subunit 4
LWEDQERINEFSKLNARLSVLEETVKKQEEEKEYLDGLSLDMELLDEDDKVQYKIGDAFVYLEHSKALERVEQEMEETTEALKGSELEIEKINSTMEELKKHLYGKFGTSINLER